VASFYVYLISSLPMLHFGSRPHFSLEQFFQMCRDFIPEGDFKILQLCADGFLENNPGQPTLTHWREFEIGLRNELVKIRSGFKKIEPDIYLRPGGQSESALYQVAMNSRRSPSLIESEKFLDQERWRKLEELAFGHYFDLDVLIIYCLKLSILWRWERISQADREKLLEQALSANKDVSI
jgi:hypothetical protein